MAQKLSRRRSKIVKSEAKDEVTIPAWDLAIPDPERPIAKLHRSIAMFNQNIQMHIPFLRPGADFLRRRGGGYSRY
jgi:hypothetical protein